MIPEINETVISDGRLPIFPKPVNAEGYLFNPGQKYQKIKYPANDKVMVPYYRVKKNEVSTWLNLLLTEFNLSPANNKNDFEAILISVFDQDGGEPNFGAAIILKDKQHALESA